MKLSCRRIMSEIRRVFAISDLHVDYLDNREFIKTWTHLHYHNDVLIVAGDVTDSISLLKETFQQLKKMFYKVFYVTGNHELWIKRPEECKNSIVKFHEILKLCDSMGILTKAEKIQMNEKESLWICPVFSWYSDQDDDLANSLYMTATNQKADENARNLWMDNHLCIWPELDTTKSEYFQNFNKKNLPDSFDGPVITFSHFLPRKDLIFANEIEKKELKSEQERLGKDTSDGERTKVLFNFSMYAGCQRIEKQIRQIKPIIHVYGHQHRQRDRDIDGIHYVSHCLGYKRERDAGFMWGIHQWKGPKKIWPQSK
ncbi:hypothetical protein LOTGIDRAFT_162173 [Lottia gigantea]|uniref:Calcineurin-like phosphoesterase domain-containing protein n=1 Tax=Lottia gigantea TaxID=225164 RepID=V4BVT0_LOTGI|nr:hypothetical protein LOTGIDRAFT_162173 [Lottia gigantea]ESO93144.1 hypothetical protein LOTGIDRAFT_162173 [Lottia gigantea]